MILADVNVLVYAADQHFEHHLLYRNWLEETIHQPHAFGMSEVVLSGFLRIVTNPRILKQPMQPSVAIRFVKRIHERPNCVVVQPGPRHWDIFIDLCRKVKATGNVVPDAYYAALAIESGCEWLTADRGFGKFPGLRWRHPLDP